MRRRLTTQDGMLVLMLGLTLLAIAFFCSGVAWFHIELQNP